MNIINTLEQLKEVNAALEITRLDYEAQRAAILATVQNELDELAAEYEPLLATARERLQTLENDAKQQVIATGETAKVEGLAVVFVKGRTSWNTKALDGYAAAHPEIEQFRTQGQPSARITWK